MAEGNGNGRRWTDSSKVIWGLFGACAFLLTMIGTLTWGRVVAMERSIQGLTTSRDKMEVQFQEMLRRVDRVERKLEKGD